MSEFRTNEELVACIQSGEKELLPQLWEQVQRFCRQEARPFAAQCGDPEQAMQDLLQESFFAVREAAEKHMLDSGASFIRFLKFFLLMRFNAWMAKFSGPVCIPVNRREKVRQLIRTETRLQADQGGSVDVHLTAAEMGIPTSEVANLRSVLFSVGGAWSLDASVPGMEDDDVSLRDTVASAEDIEEDVLGRVYADERRRLVWQIAAGYCSQREFSVLQMYYIDDMRLADIGPRLGISVARAAQIRNAAVRKLRKSKAALDLSERLEDVDCMAYRRGGHISGNSWTSSTERTAIKRLETVDAVVHRMERDEENRITYTLMR